MDSEKEYMVSLDLWHARLALNELEAALGTQGGKHSHSLGDQRSGGRVWTESVWRLSSEIAGDCPLGAHLAELRERAEKLGLLRPEALPDGAEGVLNVGVMYSTPYCTVELPSAWLAPFISAGFTLSFATYPVGESNAT